jgi:hypothetical protein
MGHYPFAITLMDSIGVGGHMTFVTSQPTVLELAPEYTNHTQSNKIIFSQGGRDAHVFINQKTVIKIEKQVITIRDVNGN